MKAKRIYAVMYRSIVLMKRNMFRFFDVTLWPLILFLSVTLFVNYLKEDTAILGIVILGVIGWRTVYHLQIEFSQGYMDLYWSGMIGHFMVSPATLIEFIIGNVVVGVIKFAFVAGFYVLLAKLLFGYMFVNVGLILFGLFSLGVFGIILGLITLGICFIFHENAFAVAYILPDLIVLSSGVYYPITVFPTAMQAVIYYFPTYYGFEILKASVGAGTVNLPWLFGTTLVWFVASLFFLWWCKKYTMKQGLFARLN